MPPKVDIGEFQRREAIGAIYSGIARSIAKRLLPVEEEFCEQAFYDEIHKEKERAGPQLRKHKKELVLKSAHEILTCNEKSNILQELQAIYPQRNRQDGLNDSEDPEEDSDHSDVESDEEPPDLQKSKLPKSATNLLKKVHKLKDFYSDVKECCREFVERNRFKFQASMAGRYQMMPKSKGADCFESEEFELVEYKSLTVVIVPPQQPLYQKGETIMTCTPLYIKKKDKPKKSRFKHQNAAASSTLAGYAYVPASIRQGHCSLNTWLFAAYSICKRDKSNAFLSVRELSNRTPFGPIRNLWEGIIATGGKFCRELDQLRQTVIAAYTKLWRNNECDMNCQVLLTSGAETVLLRTNVCSYNNTHRSLDLDKPPHVTTDELGFIMGRDDDELGQQAKCLQKSCPGSLGTELLLSHWVVLVDLSYFGVPDRYAPLPEMIDRGTFPDLLQIGDAVYQLIGFNIQELVEEEEEDETTASRIMADEDNWDEPESDIEDKYIEFFVEDPSEHPSDYYLGKEYREKVKKEEKTGQDSSASDSEGGKSESGDEVDDPPDGHNFFLEREGGQYYRVCDWRTTFWREQFVYRMGFEYRIQFAIYIRRDEP